jgi:uncharacterized protein with beta-barrel porin domain
VLAFVGFVSESTHAQTVINVTDASSLAAAIAQVDTNASAQYVINLQNSITLTAGSTLPAFDSTSSVTVNGNNFTLNGGGIQRGIFVFSGNVAIDNITIQNAQALGGAGSSGSGSGGSGGGGLGAGGALFVASGANVTVSNVAFTANNAAGGVGAAGGAGVANAAGAGGAGGGLGGNAAGGGGGVGLGANGGTNGNAGSAGIILNAGSGGAGININNLGPGGAGGASGGGGGDLGGGGGINGASTAAGGKGGFGGGAGFASSASGGFGGGGGGGNPGNGGNSTSGGLGGFGAGGGGGGGFACCAGIGNGAVGAGGGFGAGIGGTGANGQAGSGGGGGGGGAGLGGAIFVQEGGNLIIAGALSVNGNTVTPGAGGTGGAAAPGGTAGSGGSNGTTFGAGLFLNGSGTLTLEPGAGHIQNFADVIADQTGSGGTAGNAGSWAVNVSGGGTLVLSGDNTYSGGTTVTGATLVVNGSIGDPIINAGGVLMGTGSVGGTQINSGGTFAPGNGTAGTSMTIAGNLAFQSGAIYLVQVNPATSSFANVTGTATLGGATVNAVFANGSYISKQYTILTATGGVSGTFNPAVVSNNPNLSATLSYDANDVFLNEKLAFAIPGGLNQNQQAVGNALTNLFNTTGGIPTVFGTLTPAGLTQASGELGTGSQQTTFDAMNQFMGLLTDPFMNRGGGAGSPPSASGYLEEGDASAYASTKKTDAFAMFTKAPPAPFVQRWSVWTAGFGGSQSTDGNAATGSNNTTSSVYGTAVGADYLFSPNTIAGFALAGGGTNFSVVNSGSGHSDLFQAGAYVRHTEGAAYISAALAYGWQDITTNRTVAIGGIDQLRAEFDANAYSGRVEGGYRFVAPWTGGVGITPYAAGQFTTFDLPSYAESVLSGAGSFALAYGAKDVTDSRSELGFRTDKSFLLQDGILILRTRFGWAHDFDPDRSIGATFQTLPGASFVVNGAAQAADSALTTASIEMKWKNGWSAAATFEGEFSDVTSSYAGKGVLRYQW